MEKEIRWLLQEKYHNKPTKQFYKDVKRLKAGEPPDFVISFIEFLGCKIDLSKKPLIPRQETEYWTEKAVEEIGNPSSLRSSGQNLRVLDMFSGSGCIGLAVLKNTKATVVFAEQDKKALEQIKINVKLNKIEKGRYITIKSDIFKSVVGEFDFILANPPYIPTARAHKVQISVLKYEPKIALFGGKDGLLYIRKFLAKAKSFLARNGTIYMEFDYIEKKQIEKLLKQYRYKTWSFKKDQYGKVRYVIIRR